MTGRSRSRAGEGGGQELGRSTGAAGQGRGLSSREWPRTLARKEGTVRYGNVSDRVGFP